MIKLFVLMVALTILFIGCNESNNKTFQETKDDLINLRKRNDSLLQKNQEKIDSIINQKPESSNLITFQLNRIDSNLKYYRLATEYDLKEEKIKFLYYQTGDERYYNQFNKLEKIRMKYIRLCNYYSNGKIDSLNYK